MVTGKPIKPVFREPAVRSIIGRRRLSKPLFRPYCRIKKPNTTIMAICPAAESKNARSTLSVISMLAIVVISMAGIVTRITMCPTFLFVSNGRYPFLLQ